MFFKTGSKKEIKITPICDSARHLVCLPYSIDNLHAVAQTLNIKRHWFHGNHYDIPLLRKEEIKARCVLVTSRQVIAIIQGVVKTTADV
jgi:hypothetical protein